LDVFWIDRSLSARRVSWLQPADDGMGVATKIFWVVVAAGIALWLAGRVEGRYVWLPLLGLAIWRIGLASFRSLAAGGDHIPDGPPQPVDTLHERTTYWCAGCGAELLLLVRGSDAAPRHCGEKMQERHEVPRLT
jgi:DNA-directed RNA polymerase subunit RPC12/RpoP